ncbi:hypothetical protein [Ulvibacter litoralis]|uniref:Uncharacterized protein n=1 Tax=Ulvibacter litoralis TaxID=227084 RepID=A0A1G7C1W8_9FLAO|nr:hypothetical protein [Ulvibacter litoralis]GHC49212.1 hypothetical protein GCM10008083_10870 [Ulvibacter litoralis]SDE32425.1 hypothetical protein SAMN05421855_10199 [Ulvibacter litoralis]
MKTNLSPVVAGFLLFFVFVSCIKDTDFDQVDNVDLTPTIDLDLIYFNLSASDFYDPATSTSVLTVSDTTELRFLNDIEVQRNLKRAEFYFKFTNSIEREFQADFQFLTPQNDTTYTAQTVVAQGTVSNPIITEFIENVEGADIVDLTQASKVIVSVTIPSSNANLEGALNLQSKVTYYVEL